jgi:hypothetical protein
VVGGDEGLGAEGDEEGVEGLEGGEGLHGGVDGGAHAAGPVFVVGDLEGEVGEFVLDGGVRVAEDDDEGV